MFKFVVIVLLMLTLAGLSDIATSLDNIENNMTVSSCPFPYDAVEPEGL